MTFKEIQFSLPAEFTELLIAELSQIDYDSFWEQDSGVFAYIAAHKFDSKLLEQLKAKHQNLFTFSYSEGILENKNWNHEWEKNFEPIAIEEKLYIRATFHEPNPKYPIEVVIDPKMSFGTGHHDTTSLMASFLLENELKGKSLLDIGCGTGILAILGGKLGASAIFAFDNDEWAYNNCVENCQLNGLSRIETALGTITEVSLKGPYDVVLANINRNILLAELSAYTKQLKPKSELFISGFYVEDIPVLREHASNLGLAIAEQKSSPGNWAALKLVIKSDKSG